MRDPDDFLCPGGCGRTLTLGVLGDTVYRVCECAACRLRTPCPFCHEAMQPVRDRWFGRRSQAWCTNESCGRSYVMTDDDWLGRYAAPDDDRYTQKAG